MITYVTANRVAKRIQGAWGKQECAHDPLALMWYSLHVECANLKGVFGHVHTEIGSSEVGMRVIYHGVIIIAVTVFMYVVYI